MKTALRNYLLSLVLILTALPSFAALPATFIDTATLADLGDKAVLVDVRNLALYLVGHIKGAIQIPKDDFLETRRGVKSLIPNPKAWESLLSKNGISPEITVVAYSDSKDPYAARFIWSLRYYGHTKSFVLDGGIDKWTAEGRPVEFGMVGKRGGTDYKIKGSSPIRVEADTILTRLGSPNVVVWDTRSNAEYLGLDVRADRGGHIPGATHLDWTELQTVTNGVRVLKEEGEILALLASKGLTPETEIYAHCQTGIRSSYATLVLEGYGYPHIMNYDGSWIEWGNERSLPVEQGSGNSN